MCRARACDFDRYTVHTWEIIRKTFLPFGCLTPKLSLWNWFSLSRDGRVIQELTQFSKQNIWDFTNEIDDTVTTKIHFFPVVCVCVCCSLLFLRVYCVLCIFRNLLTNLFHVHVILCTKYVIPVYSLQHKRKHDNIFDDVLLCELHEKIVSFNWICLRFAFFTESQTSFSVVWCASMLGYLLYYCVWSHHSIGHHVIVYALRLYDAETQNTHQKKIYQFLQLTI